MAAGARGGNQHFAFGIGPTGQQPGNVRLQAAVVQIERQGAAQRLRLFVDLSQHFVCKAWHFLHSSGLFSQAKKKT